MKERGFSLLSVLVAMILLIVGILALSQTMIRAQQLETRSDLGSVADVIANGYMEEILTRDPGALVSESPVRVGSDGREDEGGSFTRSVTVEPAHRIEEGAVIEAKFLRRVTVLVSYVVGGRDRQSRFTTLVYATEK